MPSRWMTMIWRTMMHSVTNTKRLQPRRVGLERALRSRHLSTSIHMSSIRSSRERKVISLQGTCQSNHWTPHFLRIPLSKHSWTPSGNSSSGSSTLSSSCTCYRSLSCSPISFSTKWQWLTKTCRSATMSRLTGSSSSLWSLSRHQFQFTFSCSN